MDAANVAERQRAFFRTGVTRAAAFRLEQLERLRAAIVRHEAGLLEALRADLGKPALEAYTSEIGFVLEEIRHARRCLPRWMRARRFPTPPLAWPGRSASYPEPRGAVLILGPWNYPFQLLLSPLVAAVAAGNCVCLKPSELAPRTSRALAALVDEVFDSACVCVVEGAADAAQALLAQRWDHIFFTGSARVGRLVMQAAAERLTPVTLELGGKCPCLVCADANLAVAARRILWGKCLNAGQTCVAPDFVLVEAAAREAFLRELERAYARFFPGSPRRSAHYGRIVNDAHFQRLLGYLDQGRTVLGGDHDAAERYLGPTVLTDVPPQAAVMQEEIFGPVLPVVEAADVDAALALLRERPAPLALYVFSESRDRVRRILRGSESGGVCVNDTVLHILGRELPFGGVGESGMGAYRGRAGFETFTHRRSVMHRGTSPDPGFRYPPSAVPLGVMRRLLRVLLSR